MKTVKKIRNYLLDEIFNMRILENKIDICNYDSIEYFDNDQIIIKHTDGKIKIKGENLVATKLMNDEILISGDIKNIEMR